MRFERDEEAVRSAREEKKKAEDEIAIANIQKEIDLIQESIDALEKHKEALQEELEAINEYYENLIEETEKMYDQMIKDTESYWQEIIEGLEAVKSKWEELAEIETISKAWADVGKAMEDLGYTVEDVLNDTPGAFEAFKQEYINTLAAANSENKHFLDGLNYATDGAAKAFGAISENAGEIEQSLGKVADATQPLEGAADNISSVGTAAGEAKDNVGGLAKNTSDLANDATKIAELATQVDAVKSSIQNLSNYINDDTQNPFKTLLEPIDELMGTLERLSSLIYGQGTNGVPSITQAFNNLKLIKFDEVIAQFKLLDETINAVVNSLSGGGKEQNNESNQNGARGANGTGENGQTTDKGEEGADNLVDAIGKVKEATTENIGNGSEEEGDTAIGSFVALKQSVDAVSTTIGAEDVERNPGEHTLISCIRNLKTVVDDNMPEIISQFSELADIVAAIADSINEIINGLNNVGGHSNISGMVMGWRYAGTAHAEGTAKASGDWRVGRNEKSLVGELGQELVVEFFATICSDIYEKFYLIAGKPL